mgnify:CR=1 FL=1
MLCKNCGKELPIAGKFCPFCGAAVEQTGVNDETAVFTTLPDDMKDPVETGSIDTSAFDAAMRDEKQQFPVDDTAADPLADTNPNIPNPNIPTQLPCVRSTRRPVRRTAGHARAPHDLLQPVRPIRRTAFTKSRPRENAA